uniref:SDR n=1 Tax=Scytalidium album TaxID=1525810 RepID=A0A8A5D7E8_9PEZI|nr:SDR [Scytalidium album]
MAFNISGKTAVVTGAGSGICLAFAQLLLKGNCNVIFADLALRPEAESLVADFPKSTSGPRAVFQKTDVTEWDQLNHMFEVADAEFGGADIICPGAGVYEPAFSNFWNPPGSKFSKDTINGSRYTSLDINLVHPIRSTQMAIDHFIKRGKPGVVVHISSIAAQRPLLSCPLYVAAKSGVSNFVRSLASLEFPEHGLPTIRVNAVAPGVIKTPLWTECPDKLDWIDETKDDWVGPEEVAQAMKDLIEKEEYIGGTVLEVGKNQTRKVEVLNDPGPHGAGHTVSGSNKGIEEVWQKLSA